jgi:hypothetical protein
MVGNSHLAALKSGWKQIGEEFSDVSITMFGAPGSSFFDVDVRDGQIVAGSEKAAASFEQTGGTATVPVEDFDAVVVVSAGLGFRDTLASLKTHLPYFLISERFSIAVLSSRRDRRERKWTTANGILRQVRGGALRILGDRLPPSLQLRVRTRLARRPLVSASAFDATLRGTVRASHAGHLTSRLAEECDLPVYYLPTPRPSAALKHMSSGSMLARADEDGWGELIARKIDAAIDDALDGLARVVPQPPETIERSLFTLAKFSQGSSRLNDDGTAHADYDSVHMNAQYGALVLRDLIGRLRADRVRAGPAADRPHLT